jgi:hypothetical protein
MTKETKQILKKSYDSVDWNKISKSQVVKELDDKAIEVLNKGGRVKTSKAIYVIQ